MAAPDDTQTLPGTSHRAAIVGAGPAGFYTADQLLKQGFEVDLYDELPTPFGLVRSGVAPDHPKIKAVTRVYEKTARKEGFRFFGGVRLGEHVTRDELLERYHAVVYAFGTADDNRLGIPGEDRPGSHSATHFVAWYNGHPRRRRRRVRPLVRARRRHRQRQRRDRRRADARPRPRRALADRHGRPRDRGVRRVAGHGGRAARPPRPGAGGVHQPRAARAGRAQARRRRRRAPTTSSSTPPASAGWPRRATRPRSATSRSCAPTPSAATAASRTASRCASCARRSRSSARARTARSPASASRVNAIEADEDGNLRAVPTGEEELIECGLVLRSIGYRGRPVDDRPLRRAPRPDPQRGRPRDRRRRRARAPASTPSAGSSAARPGVIGTNKKDAADTVAKIVEDATPAPTTRPRRARRRRDRRVDRRARARRRDVGGLAGDRRARARAGRAARPPAGQARARGRPDRRRPRHGGGREQSLARLQTGHFQQQAHAEARAALAA